jgi:glycosyltransferase involved in cell wall biosynthesis
MPCAVSPKPIRTARSFLVGPVATRLPALPANVHVLGARPHPQLPPVLRALDCGLLPVRRLRVMESANHVKLYEYLAAGLPIVATTSREVTPFAAHVERCERAADWPAAAARALAAPRTTAAIAARRAVALANLWSDKAAALWNALEACR